MKLKIFVISFLVFLLAGYGFVQSKEHAFWLTKYYAKHKNNKKLESLIDMDLIKDSYEKTLIYQITLDYKDHHPNSQNYFPPVFAQYVKNKTQVSVTKEHVIDEIIEQLSKAKDFNYKNGEKGQVILSYKLDDYEEYLVYSKVNGDWKIISVNLPKISPVFQNRKIEIHGTYYTGTALDVQRGVDISRSFDAIKFNRPYDFIDTSDDGSTEVMFSRFMAKDMELGGSDQMFYGLKDGDKVLVRCSSIFAGVTIHFALPLYCEDAQILKQQVD